MVDDTEIPRGRTSQVPQPTATGVVPGLAGTRSCNMMIHYDDLFPVRIIVNFRTGFGKDKTTEELASKNISAIDTYNARRLLRVDDAASSVR
jgi:hypothetical protein